MYITNCIKPFIVFIEDSISTALGKIEDNKERVVFVVSEHGKLAGTLSDGDIRRWLTRNQSIDLDSEVCSIMNTKYSYSNTTFPSDIDSLFQNGVTAIPIVDSSFRLFKIAFKNQHGIQIEERSIREGDPAYVIAEIGNNHQGDIELAKKLVGHAIAAGADCAKFQMRHMERLYKNAGDSDDASADLAAQYTMDLLSRYQLSNVELFDIFDYCKSKGITPLCTPWDLESLRELEAYGMPAYKIASADFTNYELLKAVAQTGKPFFASTGMCSEFEIKSTISFLSDISDQYVLLHCNSTYPTPLKDVNLNYMTRLRELSGNIVGYSGHERGIEVPIGAVSMGACVIEKHLTIDKSLEGADHKVSLLPNEFKQMTSMIRNLEIALGRKDKPREVSQGELLNRENLAKSLVANRVIPIGTVFSREMITVKSPGQGVQPNRLDELLGTVSQRNIGLGDFFYDSDINGTIEKKTNYSFKRPFGVPVRYHDYKSISGDTNLDFVEFHLSYKDLNVQLDQFFSGPQSMDFAVHSPELFANDHILDLCSRNVEYRKHSISLLGKVIDITLQLNQYFPKTKKPIIVVNAGGWDFSGFTAKEEKSRQYAMISEALAELDTSGVTIAVQTMPPFPWHFGGQSYHNLFVSSVEIQDFCEENKDVKICLDISHSMMACNYYNWNLLEFVERVLPYTVHMHIVDAKGIDGEGVKIGEGDVDFTALAKLLDEKALGIQFLPEVWQGHKNNGEGFWQALDYLERYLN